MKILMICTRIPYPLTAGFRIRIYNEAKYAKRAGHSVGLLYVGDAAQLEKFAGQLAYVFDDVYQVNFNYAEAAWNILKAIPHRQIPFQVAMYNNKQMKRILREKASDYDVFIGNNVRTAEVLKMVPLEKVVFDYHDAISYNYKNAILCTEGIKKLLYIIENKRLVKYEKIISERFKRTVIISEEDKAYLKTYGCKTDSTVVIPVAVRDDIVDKKDYCQPEEDTICFLGKMSYQPNEDAVVWFVKNVYPQLKAKYPNLKFYIIGIEPGRLVQSFGKQSGIRVTGFMENPYALISKCKVMVVPIQNGAGMQNKVLESMLVGTPTVISSIAAEGIEGQDGVDYYIADRPDDYIRKISLLFEDRTLRHRIGESAQKLVKNHYSWDVLWKKWEDVITGITR